MDPSRREPNAFATLRIHSGTNRNSINCPSCGEEREPGWASRVRFRPVMNAQDTANSILVDFNAASQRDLLGDSGTTPVGITPLHFNYCVDEFSIRSFRARLTPALGRKQQNKRYFRCANMRSRSSSVDGFNTIAQRKTRAGFMKRTHNRRMKRSAALRLGARLRINS